MQTVSPYPPRGSDKIWAIFSHLAAFIGAPILVPLIICLAMRNESEYVTNNAREALNFHLSLLIYSLCCIPLAVLVIGIPFLVLIGLASLILSVIAAIKASEGGCYRYPLTVRMVK